MSIKDQITKIKEYAELAWASYAMLQYIDENEKIFPIVTNEEIKKAKKGIQPRSRWIYADGIKRGYEISDKDLRDECSKNLIRDNHRSLGQPTAYALVIEASFSEKKTITINGKKIPIENRIQNFIERNIKTPSLKDQKIQVSTTKEKMIEEDISHYLSIQTKTFTSRYELKFHQPNTSSGFSATLFYDTQEDEYIVSFRGTEGILSMDTLQDISIFFGGNLQEYALKQFLLDISHILNRIDSNKIIFVGHSMGGFLATAATQYCDTIDKTLDTDFNKINFSPSKVYTFNSPPTGGKEEIFMKFVADLLGNNIAEEILHPEKITHIYDKGGIEVVASAQYGAINKLALYTGEDSHSIIPITKTLYLYEYLLALSNNEKIFVKEKMQDSLDALNTYHQNLGRYFDTFLTKMDGYIDRKTMENTRARNFEKPPLSKKLLELYLDISQKVEQTPMGMLFGLYLYSLDKKTEKQAMVKTLFDKKDVIEIITSLKEESLFVRSIDNDRLKEYQTNIQMAQDDIAIRVALSTFAIFIFVNQEDQSILTKEEFLSIFGYSTPEIIVALADWDKDYLAFQAKTTRAFYFEGSVQVRA